MNGVEDAVEQPVFYYDLSSPESYLTAERVNFVLGAVPEWQPVDLRGLATGGVGEVDRAWLEARAAAQGLQAIRWPAAFPSDTAWALLVATYAKHIGRAVAFSLAAFRQAFAAGHDLGERDYVLLAGAACEMHPTAVIKSVGLRSVRERLEAATQGAAAAGVLDVPAIRVGERVFHGDRALEAAAAALVAA